MTPLRIPFNGDDARRSLSLDNAARMRREAAARQDRADYLCRYCRGPDGYHVSECQTLQEVRPA